MRGSWEGSCVEGEGGACECVRTSCSEISTGNSSLTVLLPIPLLRSRTFVNYGGITALKICLPDGVDCDYLLRCEGGG